MQNDEYIEGLKVKAYELLDENKFNEAIEAYRKIILLGELSREVRINSSVSETEAQLSFAREVSKIDGWLSSFYEAEVAVKVGRYPIAIKICSELLETCKFAMKDEVTVRILRLRAACKGGYENELIEDFLKIWEVGRMDRMFRLIRKTIIKDIAKIENPNMKSSLLEILKHNSVSPDVSEFILKKANELDALKILIQKIAPRKT